MGPAADYQPQLRRGALAWLEHMAAPEGRYCKRQQAAWPAGVVHTSREPGPPSVGGLGHGSHGSRLLCGGDGQHSAACQEPAVVNASTCTTAIQM